MTTSRVLLGVLVGCLAMAASSPSVAASDPAQGKAAFDEGQRRFLAGDYREALTWFKQGYLSTDDPAFLLNMAQCQRLLGDPREALVMYRLYLKSTSDWANREARAVATKAIQELESEAAAAPRAASAPIVPGPAAETAPATPPGSPTLGVAPRGQPGSAAYPILDSVPGLDAKQPPVETPAPADRAETRARRLRLAGMISGAAGVVSLGAGVYFWTRATSLSDSANTAAAFHQADYDAGKRAETMQWVFYTAGVAAIATGAGLYLYGRRRPVAKDPSFEVVPIVGPGGTSLGAKGAF